MKGNGSYLIVFSILLVLYGICGQESCTVYVSVNGIRAGDCGSANEPCGSLLDALTQCNQSYAVNLYLNNGIYDMSNDSGNSGVIILNKTLNIQPANLDSNPQVVFDFSNGSGTSPMMTISQVNSPDLISVINITSIQFQNSNFKPTDQYHPTLPIIAKLDLGSSSGILWINACKFTNLTGDGLFTVSGSPTPNVALKIENSTFIGNRFYWSGITMISSFSISIVETVFDQNQGTLVTADCIDLNLHSLSITNTISNSSIIILQNPFLHYQQFVISNIVITNNSLSSSRFDNYIIVFDYVRSIDIYNASFVSNRGGCILISGYGLASITNSVFTDNIVEFQKGIVVSNRLLDMSFCVFERNLLLNLESSVLSLVISGDYEIFTNNQILDTVFNDNTSQNSTIIVANLPMLMQIQNLTITNNTALIKGSGVFTCQNSSISATFISLIDNSQSDSQNLYNNCGINSYERCLFSPTNLLCVALPAPSRSSSMYSSDVSDNDNPLRQPLLLGLSIPLAAIFLLVVILNIYTKYKQLKYKRIS